MNVLLMTDGDRTGAFLLDASGRIVASVADNLIPPRAAGPWDQNVAPAPKAATKDAA